MLAFRLVKGSSVPTTKAYVSWLSGIMAEYPQITDFEPTNEPELTEKNKQGKPKMSEADAVRLYLATRSLVGANHDLAGGFSDKPGRDKDKYVRRYVQLMERHTKLEKEDDPRWALHFYNGIVRQRPDLIKRRIKMVHAKPKQYDITETSSFVELGNETFTTTQQNAQVHLVEQISKGARRTFWTGAESCIGCQPHVTAPAAQQIAQIAPNIGPVLPFKQPSTTIKWDGNLFATNAEGVTTLRPGMAAVLDKKALASSTR